MTHHRRTPHYEPVTPPGASPDTPILVVDTPSRPHAGGKRRQPSSPLSDAAARQTKGVGLPSPEGAVAYSPMLPHGFAMGLPPGAVDATTAARVAFSLVCLRSSGPVCRNVVGPLVHTLGRYFAGGGHVTVAGRTGSTREYRSVEALVATRRTGFGPDDAHAAARRWLAACALSQVNAARWHPRQFVPPDAALDAVYAYLADTAAPMDLLRVAPAEMSAWLQRSGDMCARLSWAVLYATATATVADGAGSVCGDAGAVAPYQRVDVGRLALALDALPREPGLSMAAPLPLTRQTAVVTGEAIPHDRHTAPNLCGCPSARLCTAWGPERSVGAWQRSAIGAVAFVVAAPVRAGANASTGANAARVADRAVTGACVLNDGRTPATTATSRPFRPRAMTEADDRGRVLCVERDTPRKRSKLAAPTAISGDSDPVLPPSRGPVDGAPPPCRHVADHPADASGSDGVAQDESFWQWLDEQFPCEPLPFISSLTPLPPPPSP